MIKKTMTYTDYNGEQRTEDFYFNFTKTELMKTKLMELELNTPGGLTAAIETIAKTKNLPAIIEIFDELILKSYGVKSADGKRFEKSEQLSREFSQTEAYDQLFQEISTNPDALEKFVTGVIPAGMVNQISASK